MMPPYEKIASYLKTRFSAIPLVDRQWSKELETDQERRALFLRILNRGWLVMSLLGVLFYIFFPEERVFLALFIFVTFFIFYLVRYFNRVNKTWLAGFIFTSFVNTSIFGVFLFIGLTQGFSHALYQYQYVLMIMGLAVIFAGALIHRWAAFSLAALNSILLLFITEALAPEAGPVFSVHIFWWLVAIGVWLYETSLFIAFDKLKFSRTDLENQVLQRTHSLQELVARLEQTQESLKAKNQELEAFSYSVSHDLRAPLRAIDGYSHALQEDYGQIIDPDGFHLLARLQENVRRMDRMIQNMLYLSRLDRHIMQWQNNELNRMVREVVDELRRQNPEQPVAFQIEDLPPCLADAALLRQVLEHLIGNALKFSQPRDPAVIVIASQPDAHRNVYRVQDNGVGFDMGQAHRLFAPFQRLHRTEEFPGGGIGLAIVQRIIQKHNGRIWADAEVDRGATFFFTIGSPGEGDEVISENFHAEERT
jgi:signal transduction histidine kinase